MEPNLAQYAANAHGARELLAQVRHEVIQLWKVARELYGDDLVVDINVTTSKIQINKRTKVKCQIASELPDWDLLYYLDQKPAIDAYGSIRIWALIRYADETCCVAPLTLAFS